MTQIQSSLIAGAQSSACRTVVVGVKLDSYSRELLTWALVKVAQPGDRVLALHVLNSNEIVDRDGKSSLLSLVKAFDSVLAVYDGFCNLKQVDLKLKICRGSSVRKLLVREAKSYLATEVILGTSRNHHTIRSSASVAKYCARKLSKDCSVLAVNNGKVVFHRESCSASVSRKDIEHHRRNGILDAIHRTLSKNSKVLVDGHVSKPALTYDEVSCGTLHSEHAEKSVKHNCSICQPDSFSLDNSSSRVKEGSPDENDKEMSMSIVPVQKIEAASSSISLLIREFPEARPGWPLLRRAVLSNQQGSDCSSGQKISVVQWALRLPSRHFLLVESSDKMENRDDKKRDESPGLDGESGAIVPVGNDSMYPLSPLNPSSKTFPKELDGLHEKYSATCRLFEYHELVAATSNFLPENIIGKGGSSKVYRGCLPDGKELAVKILKPSEDALKEFLLEIEIINAINHKNVISLFGFCFDENNLLLVYDFLSRGSLEKNLHGNRKDSLAFGWSERFKVAVGVAEALLYLHSREVQPVIHRDVKSSNVLLSDDFEPQLSDFGLAKWASTNSSHTTYTDVAGTFGYLAPEYFTYGKVNEKIDVYAFGVVLLELLSGRKPISSDYPKGQESLVMWANPILSCGKFAQLLDPSLGSNYDHEQVERVVLAAALCIRRAPRARPQMSLILKLLQGDDEVTNWARLQVNASEICETKPQVNGTEGAEGLEDEVFPESNLQSHLNLAFLGIEDDTMSMSSIDQMISLDDYLRGRWSRSSSFD